ncbi:hypothetical protein NKH64_28975 [Mesorhizobium sp. M0999]|uniref:5'-methylthioadenosine/S-adenosylhomocysteine nucleosidase family protein n=1 Tax=Mesorhizobium sp. M0999 TaxID=2957045 RepID=UPI00333712F5
MKILTLMSGAVLNCSVSLLFESSAISRSDSLRRLVQFFIERNRLSILSNHPTILEFLESRAQLYSHDRLRYPMYFGTKNSFSENISIIPKSSSATSSLAASLASWGTMTDGVGERERDTKRVVLETLSRREDRAVTAALFAAATSQSKRPEAAIGAIRRQISVNYTEHFMDSLNSDICTGLSGIRYFDRCSQQFPVFDIPIASKIAKIIGITHIITQNWTGFEAFWDKISQAHTSDLDLELFQGEYDALSRTLERLYKTDGAGTDGFRIWTLQTLDRVGSYFNYHDLDVDDDMFSIAYSRLRNVIGYLCNNANFNQALEAVRMEVSNNKRYDYLLMVATDVEREAVVKKAEEIGNRITIQTGAGRAYYDLGYIFGNRVAVVKVEMGSASTGGSITTTMRVVPHLKPRFVIMVGIAFGVDEKKQSIGTVLVSRQILNYDQQRVGTTASGAVKLTPRGARTDASPVLVSLLEAASGVWDEAPVKTGLILSGDKLVDNVDFREQLKTFADGEAIGGEMEGGGLAVGAAETSAPWIVVKAICDWGDGKKSVKKKERQALAAKNAVSLVFRALQIVPDDRGVTSVE